METFFFFHATSIKYFAKCRSLI